MYVLQRIHKRTHVLYTCKTALRLFRKTGTMSWNWRLGNWASILMRPCEAFRMFVICANRHIWCMLRDQLCRLRQWSSQDDKQRMQTHTRNKCTHIYIYIYIYRFSWDSGDSSRDSFLGLSQRHDIDTILINWHNIDHWPCRFPIVVGIGLLSVLGSTRYC